MRKFRFREIKQLSPSYTASEKQNQDLNPGFSNSKALLLSIKWTNRGCQESEFEGLLFVVPWLRCVQLFVTPWTAAHPASLSFTVSQSLLKLMSIVSVIPSNYLVLCHPLLLPSNFSGIRVFSNESALHIRGSKYWGFSFSISPFNEYSGLISFRIDWLDLLAIQGTLKSLLQHHSSKASILKCSAFFIVHTWKLKLLSRVRLFSTPWTIRSMEFSRPEYCSG